MLYFQRNSAGTLRVISQEKAHTTTLPYLCRHDFETLEDAQAVAEELNGFPKLNIAPFSDKYIATDAGRSCSPRYDVISRPQVGDEVSYAFNGDYYPDGTITKISPTLKKITTDTGSTFYRVRQTGSWKKNGTWSLVHGHIDKRNPSF